MYRKKCFKGNRERERERETVGTAWNEETRETSEIRRAFLVVFFFSTSQSLLAGEKEEEKKSEQEMKEA